ncbi:hypothetical protein [Streptomyces violaceusniger]|uniref:Uncharacterized protein n=1 Tax=Streptomyces violaceusniger (strain Tu 4113) TaxID=653045 RepID=G2PHP7_STRV4|nr:hypothetical protein [Streptomyces violaceusniger]AEM88848.1 hypothetical protein Strvi_0072 [Streptomyces violaceusniger Tu 4113]
MSEQLTYTVREGGRAVTATEDQARAALAHAAGCLGCCELGAFHRSDIYGQPGLTPPEVFPLNLPTGAVLYPSSLPTRPVAERVAAALAVLAKVRNTGTRAMREAVDARIARLEAYRPE